MGWGRGRGRGWRRGGFRREPPPPEYYGDEPYDEPYYGPPLRESDPKEEKRYLEGVVEHLEREMEAVKKRLKDLTGKEKGDKPGNKS